MNKRTEQAITIGEILKKIESHRVERASNKKTPWPLTAEENRIYHEHNLKQENLRRRKEAQNRVSKNALTLWPNEIAAMPTEITRTSLFGLPRRGQRKIHRWGVLASRSDISLQYFGEELDQSDLDVWLLVLRIARGQNIGARIQVNMNAMLRELRRPNGGSNRRWLISSLDRLSSAAFKVKFTRKNEHWEIVSGLLKWGYEKSTGRMFVRVDPDGEALFDNLSYLHYEKRLNLPSSMAKAIHSYASGHRRGMKHAITMENLKEWIGYGGREVDFLRSLEKALTQLEDEEILSHVEVEHRIVRWILNK